MDLPWLHRSVLADSGRGTTQSGELMPFKVLDLLLMFFGSRQCLKGAQVATLIGLWVFLPGIYPVFTRF
jgi:hypothetical protein